MPSQPKYKSMDFGGLVLFHSGKATAGGLHDHWKDVEGELYHFPNQYRERVEYAQGMPFVYYRGVRRHDGGRGDPEYFGTGTIGAVYRDDEIPESAPKKDWAWYCTLLDYVPFATPLNAISDGQPLYEAISRNEWGVGIRPLSREQLNNLLHAAGLSRPDSGPPPLPQFEEARLIDAQALGEVLRAVHVSSNGKGTTGGGRSRASKIIGDRAESLVYRALEDEQRAGRIRDLRWLSREGETPGWDIQYRNSDGELIAVEVKGTTAPAFAAFDMTAQEWNQARGLGARYHLHLVTGCMSKEPRRFVIAPAQMHDAGLLDASPTSWTLRLLSLPQPIAVCAEQEGESRLAAPSRAISRR